MEKLNKNQEIRDWKKMNIKPNQLVHVKTQGAMGEYKYLLLNLESTFKIQSTLDDMGYGDFKIIDWKLIKVDVSNFSLTF